MAGDKLLPERIWRFLGEYKEHKKLKNDMELAARIKKINRIEKLSRETVNKAVRPYNRAKKGKEHRDPSFRPDTFEYFEQFYKKENLCFLVDPVINLLHDGFLRDNNRIQLPGMATPVSLQGVYVERDWQEPRKQERVLGLDIVVQHNKLLLFGEVGVGKTTFLKSLAIDSVCGELILTKVPVFLSIGENADTLIENKLYEYIKSQLEQAGIENPHKTVSDLKKGGFLFLFDGLDEVAPEETKKVIDGIKRSLDQFGQCTYVITCQKVTTDIHLEGFRHFQLAPFHNNQIDSLIEKWFGARGKKELIKPFRKALKAKTNIQELFPSPLLLTHTCLYYEENLELPQPEELNKLLQPHTAGTPPKLEGEARAASSQTTFAEEENVTDNVPEPEGTEPSAKIPHNLDREEAYSGVTKFVGRERELEELHQLIQDSNVVVAITGMGGLGKTELAIQYAREHLEKRSYPGGICWFLTTEGNLKAKLVDFAKAHLEMNVPDGLKLEAQVEYCWRNWRAAGQVLVVLDDVKDYQQVKDLCIPVNSERFKVLITRREQLGSPVIQMDLSELSSEAALELLASHAGGEKLLCDVEKKEDIASELCCQYLGNLPLGLELVGRYLAKRKQLPLEDMLSRLQDKGVTHKSLDKASSEMTAKNGVKAAFELTWEALNDESDESEAQKLAYLLSLFAPSLIPWQLVEQIGSEMDAEDLEDALVKLEDFHLVKCVDEERKNYQQHPLIREFLHLKEDKFASDLLKTKFCQVMAEQAREIPQKPTQKVIAAVSVNVPHLAAAATTWQDWLTDEDLIWPFVGNSRFYQGQGAYKQAEPWRKQCLLATRERLGDEHPDVASSINNLAYLYSAMGRYEAAEPLYSQALEMYKRLLGDEHPYVATSINNLAGLYRAMGRYEAAEPLYRQALEMRKRLLGDEHPDVAGSLNNLAYLYSAMGRYEAAEPLYRQALEMMKRLLGDEHPDVATSLNNLANLYREMERYEEAKLLLLQALEMRQNLLGDEHPDVATNIYNISKLYCKMGRYSDAEPLSIQALEIDRQSLGNEHPSVAASLNNLAELYYAMGRYTQAEPLYAQALEMRQGLLGDQHPDVAIILNNLANLYRELEKYEQAEPFYTQAWEIFHDRLDAEHPKTKTCWNDFKTLLQNVVNEGRENELFDNSITQRLINGIKSKQETQSDN